MLGVEVDDHFLDGLEQLALFVAARNSTFGRDTLSSKPSRRMVSIKMPSCNSPRPATSIESRSSIR